MKAIRTGILAALAVTAGVSVALSADLFHSRWGDDLKASNIGDVLPAEVTESPAYQALTPSPDAKFADLLRVSDAEMSIAPSVSQDVMTSGTIRKVGYGRVQTVNIVVTSTGTYSSDAMDDPHVMYPGIKTKRKDDSPLGVLFMALTDGRWSSIMPLAAHSFVQYGSGFGVSYHTDGKTTCLYGDGYSGCL